MRTPSLAPLPAPKDVVSVSLGFGCMLYAVLRSELERDSGLEQEPYHPSSGMFPGLRGLEGRDVDSARDLEEGSNAGR